MIVFRRLEEVYLDVANDFQIRNWDKGERYVVKAAATMKRMPMNQYIIEAVRAALVRHAREEKALAILLSRVDKKGKSV